MGSNICELCSYAVSLMVILQHSWFLEVLVVFSNLETKELALGFLILRETWSTFVKNLMRRLEV
jgi:hypothetical protein